MLFNSLSFLIFFPIVVIICFVIPCKLRWIWLLIASYWFYMGWNAAYALLLFFSTAVTFVSGLLLERYNDSIKAKKRIVAGSIVINVALLAFFKYFNFLFLIVSRIISLDPQMEVKKFDILLPVGISFYVFQALSYTMDVYRNEIEPEKNFFKYALFVSFFPQLVAGPIERSKNLLPQIRKPVLFKYENLQSGFLLMCCGYFMKLVVADNASVIVDTVFSDMSLYSGYYIVVATILFAFQIYGDFGGYSLIAIGAAKILGFDLMRNFNGPYTSTSVSDFWRRWHISLTTWFRDYLYIPIGGNRKGKIRKWVNIMIVFLTSGLWHGASLHYVVWGGYNGVLQIIGEILKRPRDFVAKKIRVDHNTVGVRIARIILTFILIDIGWLMFRAEGISQLIEAVRGILNADNYWVLFDGSLYTLGLSEKQFRVLTYSIIIVQVIDVLRNRGMDFVKGFLNQHFIIRDLVYVSLVLAILVFGHWGGSYDEKAFLYFAF